FAGSGARPASTGSNSERIWVSRFICVTLSCRSGWARREVSHRRAQPDLQNELSAAADTQSEGRPGRQVRYSEAVSPASVAFPLPVHLSRVGPQFLQLVVVAGVRVEHVDHDVAVVLHHPLARLVPLDPHPL